MSTFREHKTIADRAASDRSRHRKKVEKAIKERKASRMLLLKKVLLDKAERRK
jgi:hypothetical protein